MIKMFGILLILMSLTLLSCSDGNNLSGGSNQTDNAKIQISLLYPNGDAAIGANIKIRPADYIANGNDQIYPDNYLDSSGSYKYENLVTGTYTAEISDSSHRMSIIHFNITNFTDTTVIETLNNSGSLSGYVETDGDSCIVYILGTENRCIVDERGIYTFEYLAEYNNYTLIYYSNKIDTPIQSIDSIEVLKDSLVISNFLSTWNFNQKIKINTTSSGTLIQDTLFYFPLLINLNSSNFNFNQALENGNDIRFFTSDSISINYEIEYYSNKKEEAIIWLNIPQIIPNNNSQYIVMKWGNEEAISKSNSSGVFSESNFYRGVWHFGGNLNDATSLKNNGEKYGTIEFDSISSIGTGIHLYENNSFIEIDNESNFDITDEITISAWITADSLSKYSWNDAILSKGENAYSLSRAIGKDVFSMTSRPEGSINNISAEGFTQLNDLNIHYLTGVKRGDSLYIYTDGVQEGSYYHPQKISQNDKPLLIGAKDTSNQVIDIFHGVIDEIRISNIGRSLSWIRLSYENQKANSSVLQFQ